MGTDLDCPDCGKSYSVKEGAHRCDPLDVIEIMRAERERREEDVSEGSPELRSLYDELIAICAERDEEGYTPRAMRVAPRLDPADFRMLTMAVRVGMAFQGDREAHKIGTVIQQMIDCAEKLVSEDE